MKRARPGPGNAVFFKPLIPYKDYCADLLHDAKTITEDTNGGQRYSGAQFELALISFMDLATLREAVSDNPVDFSMLDEKCDYDTGFDWLELSVVYGDKDALAYFHRRLKEPEFFAAYNDYQLDLGEDCRLIRYLPSELANSFSGAIKKS